jgi:hypothetical protein
VRYIIFTMVFVFLAAAVYASNHTESYEKERMLFLNKLAAFQVHDKYVDISTQFNVNKDDISAHCLVGVNFTQAISEKDKKDIGFFRVVDGVYSGFTWLRDDVPGSNTGAYSFAFNSNTQYGDFAYGFSIMREYDKTEKKSDYSAQPILNYNYLSQRIDFNTRFLMDSNMKELLYFFVEPGFNVTPLYQVYPSYTFNNMSRSINSEMRQLRLKQEYSIEGPTMNTSGLMSKTFIVFRLGIDNTYNSRMTSFGESIKNTANYTYIFEFEYGFYVGMWYNSIYGKGGGIGFAFNFYDEKGTKLGRTHMIYKWNKISEDPIADRNQGWEFDVVVTMRFDWNYAQKVK